jgi:hypothetical protein
MLHMLQWLYTYDLSECSNCLICFTRMLQVVHLAIVKVDLDVAYICMVASLCFKCFQLLQTNISSVLYGCYIYFAMTIHVFF